MNDVSMTQELDLEAFTACLSIGITIACRIPYSILR